MQRVWTQLGLDHKRSQQWHKPRRLHMDCTSPALVKKKSPWGSQPWIAMSQSLPKTRYERKMVPVFFCHYHHISPMSLYVFMWSFKSRTLGLKALSLAQSSGPLAGLFARCCQGSAFEGMLQTIWVFHQPVEVTSCELKLISPVARLSFFGIQIETQIATTLPHPSCNERTRLHHTSWHILFSSFFLLCFICSWFILYRFERLETRGEKLHLAASAWKRARRSCMPIPSAWTSQRFQGVSFHSQHLAPDVEKEMPWKHAKQVRQLDSLYSLMLYDALTWTDSSIQICVLCYSMFDSNLIELSCSGIDWLSYVVGTFWSFSHLTSPF